MLLSRNETPFPNGSISALRDENKKTKELWRCGEEVLSRYGTTWVGRFPQRLLRIPGTDLFISHLRRVSWFGTLRVTEQDSWRGKKSEWEERLVFS